MNRLRKNKRLRRLSAKQKQLLDDEFMRLLDRYMDGTLSPEQRREVEQRMEQTHGVLNDATLTDEEVEEGMERVLKNVVKRTNIQISPRRKSISHSWIQYGGVAVAAVVLLFIALSMPLLKKGGAGKADSTELVAQTQIDRQFVTEGTMKKITLADGSVVHLNMGTTLSLHKGKFNADTREVWLDEGEAFFEVSKDANRPFIVHTADGLSTRVLGTSFNIKAYRQLGEQVVSVKTGRVQVSKEDGSKVLLDPNHKASFDANSRTLTAGPTDGHLAAEWRSGTIAFSDASFKEVALRLEQAFGIEVSGNHIAHAKTRVNSTFSVNTPLPVVAQALASVYKVRYRIEDQQLTFY